jgi:hypothetical protein
MGVRRDWEFDYDVDDVVRSQAADPGVLRTRRPELITVAERALEMGRKLVEPAVLTRRLAVEEVGHRHITLEGDASFTGRLVVEHLGRAETAVIILCTIGERVEEAARQESEENLGFGLALDAVGSAAVYALCAAACNRVEHDARQVGLVTGLPLSPGMEGWDVDPGQREVFSMIDAASVGVVLSPGLEMRPLKSATAVVGVGTDLAADGSICDYCSLRETCRHRLAMEHGG